MIATPDDGQHHAGHVVDAHLQTLVALMAVRMPAVRDAIRDKLPPEFVVPSSYEGESLVIAVRGVLRSMEAEGLDNIQSLRRSIRQANWILLNAMWEILTQHPRFKELEPEPVIRFFRLVRNASSHGGRIDKLDALKHGPARWRDKEITRSMEGVRVFPDVLRDGDPLVLVQDIERQFGGQHP